MKTPKFPPSAIRTPCNASLIVLFILTHSLEKHSTTVKPSYYSSVKLKHSHCAQNQKSDKVTARFKTPAPEKDKSLRVDRFHREWLLCPL